MCARVSTNTLATCYPRVPSRNLRRGPRYCSPNRRRRRRRRVADQGIYPPLPCHRWCAEVPFWHRHRCCGPRSCHWAQASKRPRSAPCCARSCGRSVQFRTSDPYSASGRGCRPWCGLCFARCMPKWRREVSP